MDFCEQSVAGAILIDSRTVSAVRPIIKAGDFASAPCAAIFRAACRLEDAGKPVDPVAIQTDAAAHGDELPNDFLCNLMEITPTAANAEQYAAIVRDEAVRRRVLEAAQQVRDAAEDKTRSTASLVADALGRFQAIDAGNAEALVRPEDAAAAFLDYRESVESGKGGAVVFSGFQKLDNILGGGLVREGLYILAARPGVGKTTLGLKIADRVAKHGPVLFVSLEMSQEQLTARRVADRSGLPISKIMLGGHPTDQDREKICSALSDIAEGQLYLNRSTSATVADIALLARNIPGLRLVVIDYLGLIGSENRSGSLYERTTANSGALKRLSRSLGVPILCLAQLNRASEQRPDKRPSMADLRDSGAIEQDADGVLLLHRPALYIAQEQPRNPWDPEVLELFLAKNRHGPTGNLNLSFFGINGRISET